eukprot:TRINITY_DN6766_c0_g1_i1.p1 TRINITY_DN6766_c0_g1~~TRINITY_DN6766_c0_g1_i1.p1  ORF type:complete len:350 (-),score=78.73 TRINITY_DN6766_c0_g1_i1:16-1065(-)
MKLFGGKSKDKHDDHEFVTKRNEWEENHNLIKQIGGDVVSVISSCEALLGAQRKLAEDLYELYPPSSTTARLCTQQTATITAMEADKQQNLDVVIKSAFSDPVTAFLAQYREIENRLRERNRRAKSCDSLRSQAAKLRSKKSPKLHSVDNKLENAELALEELTNELKKDLPLLVAQSYHFFDPLVNNLIIIQAQYYDLMSNHMNHLSQSSGASNIQPSTVHTVITPSEQSVVNKSYSADRNPFGDPHNLYGNQATSTPSNNLYGAPANNAYGGPVAGGPPPQPARAAPPLPTRALQAKAMWDFVGQNTQELSFKAGSIINVKTNQGDWWTGELQGKEGMFPGAYVQMIQ